jgi:hypothetical protein
MTEKKSKIIGFERKRGEDSDTLHFSLKVPKLPISEGTREHIRTAESEALLAARTLIDELADRLGKFGTGEKASEKSEETTEKEE